MPENHFYVFSVIIAVCALLSPGVVALINNIYSLKLHKMSSAEHAAERASDIVDGYFRTAGACLHSGMAEDFAEFGKYCDVVFLYLPASLSDEISYINYQILRKETDSNLADCIEELSSKCKVQRKP